MFSSSTRSTDESEYNKHVGWGHGCVSDVVELAVEARVKHLFLFHHDPAHDDRSIAAMVESARRQAATLGATLKIDAACEGATIRLPEEALDENAPAT